MHRQKLEQILPTVQKPASYIGGEQGCIIKDKENVKLRFAFCFPDTYEVGMSHLGMKILYGLMNEIPEVWVERCFAPAEDMEAKMREHNIPLYGLESKDDIGTFDMIGFTLQYEMSFTNVLNMLDLAKVPLLSTERGEGSPIVVGGGPCVCNPEPIADFFDLFILGEGEEVNLELCHLYLACKEAGDTREEFLKKAAQIEGVYVPKFYEVEYNEDGTVKSYTPTNGAPAVVHKRVVRDFDGVYYPDNFVVPFTQAIHDRSMVEVLRGCVRGCRFCQAGFIYRPFREKDYDTINRQAKALCDNTGYDELSLTSLSTSDLSTLEPLLETLVDWTSKEKINLALPSLRVDNFSPELLEKISGVRKSGLTFAPEAGTQRLRDVINKNVSQEEIDRTCRIAFEGGYSSVKLYFMIGLPTETMEDVEGIVRTAMGVVGLYYQTENKPKGKGVQVNVSAACFVPKPFTPFQFEPMDTMDSLKEKQKHMWDFNNTRKIHISSHDPKTSLIEAVLARGDRRLCKAVLLAYQNGCKMDSWGEYFDFDKWVDAMAQCGLTPEFYANRARSYDEVLPWDHLDYGVSKEFLIREHKKALNAKTTANCKLGCANCGITKLTGVPCFEHN